MFIIDYEGWKINAALFLTISFDDFKMLSKVHDIKCNNER